MFFTKRRILPKIFYICTHIALIAEGKHDLVPWQSKRQLVLQQAMSPNRKTRGTACSFAAFQIVHLLLPDCEYLMTAKVQLKRNVNSRSQASCYVQKSRRNKQYVCRIKKRFYLLITKKLEKYSDKHITQASLWFLWYGKQLSPKILKTKVTKMLPRISKREFISGFSDKTELNTLLMTAEAS